MLDSEIPNAEIPKEFQVERIEEASDPSHVERIKVPSTSYQKDSISLSSGEKPSLKSLSSIPQSTPTLGEPERSSLSGSMSVASFYRILSDATRAFRQQLAVSESANYESKMEKLFAMLEDVQKIQELIKQRDQIITELKKEVEQAGKDLNAPFNDVETLRKQLEQATKDFNGGNAEEKQEFQNMQKAYEDYQRKLQEIKAVSDGKGGMIIPEGAKEDYQKIQGEYNKAVETFNAYVDKRQAQTASYQSQVQKYNQAASQFNAIVTDLLNKYGIDPNTSGVLLESIRIDFPNYQKEHVNFPQNQAEKPFTMGVVSLPDSFSSLSHENIPFPDLNPLQTLSQIKDKIYEKIYQKQVGGLDQRIRAVQSYAVFFNQLDLYEQYANMAEKDAAIFSRKKMIQKILPAALFESHPAKMEGTSSSSSLLAGLDVGDSHLQAILGARLLKQCLSQLNLSQKEGIKEEEIEKWAENLLCLSLGVLTQGAKDALMPSLSVLSDKLEQLPMDHPVFPILFALSLVNRTIENVKENVVLEGIQSLFAQVPELNAISQEDKEKIAHVMNMGLLLTTGKILESVSGIKGILPSIMPPIKDSAWIPQAEEDNAQALKALKGRLSQHFIEEKYPQEEAAFLAQVGTQMTQKGLLSPNAISFRSKGYDATLMTDSLTASLLLSQPQIRLGKAQELANSALRLTLEDTPSSSEEFRRLVAGHLKDKGIVANAEVASHVLLLAPSDSTNSTKTQPKAESDMSDTLALLLEPQLGKTLTKEITDEMAMTLFGKKSLQETSQASPYSLQLVLKDQLNSLHVEQNQAMTAAVVATFKETVRDMESFYAFSLKVMDPAYLFIYSFASGIIYSDFKMKKPLDVFV